MSFSSLNVTLLVSAVTLTFSLSGYAAALTEVEWTDVAVCRTKCFQTVCLNRSRRHFCSRAVLLNESPFVGDSLSLSSTDFQGFARLRRNKSITELSNLYTRNAVVELLYTALQYTSQDHGVLSASNLVLVLKFHTWRRPCNVKMLPVHHWGYGAIFQQQRPKDNFYPRIATADQACRLRAHLLDKKETPIALAFAVFSSV